MKSDSLVVHRLEIRTTCLMTKYLSERINFMVYVISIGGKPLMPCTPVIARLLLKQGKAKCIKRTPFTIKLLYKSKSIKICKNYVYKKSIRIVLTLFFWGFSYLKCV